MTEARMGAEDLKSSRRGNSGIGNYVFQKTVGEGNFAKVKLAINRKTGHEVAVKIIDKTKLDEKKLGKLHREVRIMKLLHHPHIVTLYEVIETKSTLYLIMEYANGGELYDYLVVHGRLKEKEARIKFRQILSAVNYCHKKHVIHRDLKAENLLLDTNMDIKIADFGFSNYFDPDDKLDTFCGSPPYAAPELFQGRRYVGPEVDVWSLGVILYVLTTGCLPFDGKNLSEMREVVCRGKYRVPFYLSDACEQLLRKMLVRDPVERSSLDKFINEGWISEGFADSPITADIDQKIDIRDDIINRMVDKYELQESQIREALENNVYDDVAAIYYLLYSEMQSKGTLEEVNDSAPATLKSRPSSYHPKHMDVIKEDGVHEITQKMSEMETEQQQQQRPTPAENAAMTNTPGAEERVASEARAPRRRRFTVSAGGNGESATGVDVEAFKKRAAAAAAKSDQKADGPAKATAAASATAASTSPSSAAPAADGKQPGSDSGSDDKVPVARKRRATIVSTLKHIRRPSAEVPAEDESKPRSLRFSFSAKTTSQKAPEEIMQEISRVFKERSVTFAITGKYLYLAEVNDIKFEVEVCKLPRLKNIHGLRFKRVAGKSPEYKDLCENLLNSFQL